MTLNPEPPLEVLLGELLKARNWKLALAESCTGGLVGHRITNVPGSSDYYLGSITAYAYEAKEILLKVSHETLVTYGAVSQQTVLEMARGARKVLAADVGAAISGIAGPGGGMPGKPVGMVWFALVLPEKEKAACYYFHGNRIENKAESAETILRLLVDALQEM